MSFCLRNFYIASAAAALFLVASPGHSQDQSGSTWQYEITPYLWAAGVDGTTRIGDVSFDTSESFKDLLSSVNLAASGSFEARNGRLGILFDGMYIRLKDSEDTPGGKIHAKFIQQMYSLGGAWRVAEGNIPVDLIGGLRYNYIKPRLDTPLGNVGKSKDTVDPFIGIRGQFPLAPKWSLMGYTDIGTFDGGDWAWQLLIGADYTINDKMALKFGYRRYKIDYEKSDFEYTNTMHGLYLGLGFRF